MGMIDSILKFFNTKKESIEVTTLPTMIVKREVNVPNNIKDDYRKTIFFYAENTATRVKSRNDYVGYLNYECGITNPDIFHQQLINEGYYSQAKIEDILKKKSVTELKDLLSTNNLVAKGKKEELINYLANNLPENVISELVQGYYSLSEKGLEFYDNHQEYVKLHCYKDYQINLEDYYNATKNDTYKRNFNDVAWQIFNERTLIYQKNNEYGSVRFNYFHMANLLMRENKKEHALQLYLYCLVIDLSGVESIRHIESYKAKWCTKQEFLERLEDVWLIPSLINQIVELKEFYDDSMLAEAYSVMYLPFNVSSLEFIKELLNDAFNSAVFDVEKYKNMLINNKKKKIIEMV